MLHAAAGGGGGGGGVGLDEKQAGHMRLTCVRTALEERGEREGRKEPWEKTVCEGWPL